MTTSPNSSTTTACVSLPLRRTIAMVVIGSISIFCGWAKEFRMGGNVGGNNRSLTVEMNVGMLHNRYLETVINLRLNTVHCKDVSLSGISGRYDWRIANDTIINLFIIPALRIHLPIFSYRSCSWGALVEPGLMIQPILFDEVTVEYTDRTTQNILEREIRGDNLSMKVYWKSLFALNFRWETLTFFVGYELSNEDPYYTIRKVKPGKNYLKVPDYKPFNHRAVGGVSLGF